MGGGTKRGKAKGKKTTRRRPMLVLPDEARSDVPPHRHPTMEVEAAWLFEPEAEAEPTKKAPTKHPTRRPTKAPSRAPSKRPPRRGPPSLPGLKRHETMEVQADWLLPSQTVAPPDRDAWAEPELAPTPPVLAARARRVLPPPIPREDPKSVPPPKRSKRPPRE